MAAIRFIYYTSHFVRAAKRLPAELQSAAEERELLFRRNCFDPRLKTHKLSGRLRELWSFSLAYKYRIAFRFVDGTTVEFVDTGDHDIYQ
ncbi:type II toxin-antitoxin system mRNA interferase toxin, RelE/StbE family [Candidatus Uhrbacteria bacterium]|nr:type II toxin-antitoxin system mRNA interferase toxin, RelE/StbE family [Candidatus Uhrbacteria bacterium]